MCVKDHASLDYKMTSDNYGQIPVQQETVRTDKQTSPFQPPVASRFHTRMFRDICNEPHTESVLGKEVLEKQIGRRQEQGKICVRFGSLQSSGGEVGKKEIITIEDSDEDGLPEPHT